MSVGAPFVRRALLVAAGANIGNRAERNAAGGHPRWWWAVVDAEEYLWPLGLRDWALFVGVEGDAAM
ncbi:hypothetical protein CJ255_09225 [Candidatus Viridilinea mediisalina]|uniref:Uncharacterized protein n=1 Tax=Candidatus Viridilinea mediisalina TaxID=2024553 RepID=A0A2A6RKE3_9CHLR|nr:hypothetical protein CJ255_09225 [Candidatus Viridilinea mediisalina]